MALNIGNTGLYAVEIAFRLSANLSTLYEKLFLDTM